MNGRRGKDTVLIVSARGDAHVDDVMKELLKSTTDAVVLYSEDLTMDVSLGFSLEPRSESMWNWSMVFHHGGLVDDGTVKSVWWRKPSHYYGLPPDLSAQEREFGKGEFDQFFGSVWSLLETYWMNHPEKNRAAAWKLEQLVRAKRMGATVPRTIVSNSPEAVASFYEECNGKIVYKVMTDPLLGAVALSEKSPNAEIDALRETKTTAIGPSELEELGGVRLVPGLFQEHVPKRCEYRVTIIGDEIFAARIDSQAADGTKVDWRNWTKGGLDIPYSAAILRPETEQLCRDLTTSYGLQFAAIDLVETPDGDDVFLELNPNGQFIWVEKLAPELKMTSALAAALLRGSST
ncbi:MAG: hypothetical protein QNJ12_20675 [Ilumatobacter sp.]|uniref:hypothetical protein n=1 Tax=Ilumatobacter sp. TaxID=1967498 RepID=UPI0026160B27|nr:hypothetical protein [Ilumatobacter sp.]MDJ0771215.1 hypothetical protein [Ilumatobacter sp.]